MAENTYVIICPYDAYKLYITLVNLDTRLRFPTLNPVGSLENK